MEYPRLGQTGLKIGRLALGCMSSGARMHELWRPHLAQPRDAQVRP